MKSVDEQTIQVLDDLIRVCADSQHTYNAAGEGERPGELQQLFLSYAAERGEYVRELQAQVFALGGDSAKSQSILESMHRGWMNLKSSLASAVLDECERTEAASLAAYREALAAPLDPETRSIVLRQERDIHASHDRIKSRFEGLSYAKA